MTHCVHTHTNTHNDPLKKTNKLFGILDDLGRRKRICKYVYFYMDMGTHANTQAQNTLS